MRLFLLTLGAMLVAGAVHAGMSVPVPVPVEPSADSDSDATGAIILLALVGVVIATGMIGRTAGKSDVLDATAEDVDDTSGL